MKEKIRKVINKVLDYLIPPNIKCIYCGEEIDTPNKYHACSRCLKTLPYNNKKVCKLCGNKIIDEAKICLSCFSSPPPFKIARAPFLYEPPISGLIANIKFDNAKYAVNPLAQFMIDEYLKHNFNCDIIIPVPLSAKRVKTRKYNQAKLFADVIGKHFIIPVLDNVVSRSRHTAPQASLAWRARQENMINAFTLTNKSAIKGKNVLVVDDVFTTGATIKSLCQELKKAKPKNIYVLTLAHTYIHRRKIKKIKFAKTIKLKIRFLKQKLTFVIAKKSHD